ncbi:MAG: hypothetical protein CMQ68_00055 [Gammaproteobacteria bacterium]|nr:hypothetical protein [Gammaproteobacteria bacterium]|tara:strand:+ start:21965 stop:22660 length:696 start_codon:yes stop_codon:yes gene_type:complete
MKNNGFVYVASKHKEFINAARFSANSLRDHWPEANITLYTHNDWVAESDNTLFNNIITKDVPNHKRAKLWALDKTPYELTCYIDCDTYIIHDDIKEIFNQHDYDSDISLTKARRYAASIESKFKGGELTDHCGLFIYNNKNHTLNFMKQWWLLYCKQDKGEWIWDTELYPEYLRKWDMWTYWWLQNKTEHKIKRSYFPHPDARWNFIYVYDKKELDESEAVIIHQPVPRKN